jgi:hypothetical protein
MAEIVRSHTPHVPKHGINRSRQQEKLDMSNIPHHLKTLLMAQSEHKLKHYDPVKICTRSDSKYTSVDTRQKIAERRLRLEVYTFI